MAFHFEIAILIGFTTLTLQHPTYKEIATRFNLTNGTNTECLIGQMELSVYDDHNNKVLPCQDNLPYDVNLTLGVMVQNVRGKLVDLVYVFEGDTNGSVVHELSSDNWATIKLKAGKTRQRFTVLVQATRTVCQGLSVRCVGMDWIEFGTQSTGNGTAAGNGQSNDIEERIRRNNLAIKLLCLESTRNGHLKKIELPTELVVELENITTDYDYDDKSDIQGSRNIVMFGLSSYLWIIVFIIAVLVVVFCVQLFGINRVKRDTSFDQLKLPNSVRDRIISGRSNSRSYKVSEGEKVSFALLAKLNSSSNQLESGNDDKFELDVFSESLNYVCYSPLTLNDLKELPPNAFQVYVYK